MLAGLSKAVMAGCLLFALFHIHGSSNFRDPEILVHGLGVAMGGIVTGLMLVLFVLNPLRISLAVKFNGPDTKQA